MNTIKCSNDFVQDCSNVAIVSITVLSLKRLLETFRVPSGCAEFVRVMGGTAVQSVVKTFLPT